MVVKINQKGCIGCEMCVQTCPFGALYMKEGVAHVTEEKCTNCGACVEACPASVITLDTPRKEDLTSGAQDKVEEVTQNVKEIHEKRGEFRGVWVFVEQMEGVAAPVSWELMGEGRKLADKLGDELCGVIMGSNVSHLAQEAFNYGADKVYIIDESVLKDYRTTPYTLGLTALSEKYKPDIILMGATTLGRDLSGAVATKLQTGLTADCTILEIDNAGYLEQTRPAFGGNIMATILCRHRRPQMATVRPRVMVMPEKQEGKSGQVISENIGLKEEDVLTRIIERIKEKNKAVYLDKEEIIIAGGKGVGSKENLNLLKELADVLGGNLGASRAVIEAGWLPVDYQVGQTGITVRPRVYFAIGISGAIQHLVGMQYADTIVAINNDPDAPIFKVATYGIVGDLTKIVPAMTQAFQEKLGG